MESCMHMRSHSLARYRIHFTFHLLVVTCAMAEGAQPGCTPNERRALAQRGSTSTMLEWDQMTECVMERNRHLFGHFAMHISKAGGTSICQMYKTSKCKVGPDVNCLNRRLNFGPMWVRKSKAPWSRGLFMFDEAKELKSPGGGQSCEVLRRHMTATNEMMVMDERYLPRGAPCGDFMNVVVIREPVKRIVSHYGEILKWCRLVEKHKKELRCNRFLTEGNGSLTAEYNITYLSGFCDIVTDNYMSRSFNSAEEYATQRGIADLAGRNDTVLRNALARLARFDWILVLDSPSQTEKSDNSLIAAAGLGFKQGMPRAKQARGPHGRGGVTRVPLAGRGPLLAVNALDYALWEEAQRLHALDVVSLRRMVEAARRRGLSLEPPKGNSTVVCCGQTCRERSPRPQTL